ncbi:hypothetical protein KVR01_009310 [Diaporthe batatas]|uniref:uncharacterized protein n=1 Tax=Diaporthe batatas TaxID=748121 RepID=UPI001D050E04|nr:uncharacterized protein KVR01_009310 [Diaporthe batatas]KAG8161046.1 hypothetical protein KVR01_009310 [Diaporthe batatas]
MRSVHVHLFAASCLLLTVAAADWWDDFSNNIASDLSPLLALFGEQILDNFIFAMAPLGIVTAIVSVIRVRGGPSLRAFIGRAQEGGGIAEVELCSSTSRDGKSIETSTWEEVGERNDIEARMHGAVNFAPNPNLSFNIGTTRRPPWVYLLALGLGIATQASIVVFGGLATYFWQWQKDGASPPKWAFPVMTAGTISLSCGMFSCALLIDRSSAERVFRKRHKDHKNAESTGTEGTERTCQSTIYIVQPGNQSIGDQNYDAFAFSDASKPLTEYTTSWKRKESAQPSEQCLVWFAIGSTILGFGLQFVGLRAMHSSVSMVLLVAILVMSIMRSVLRTGRLKKEQNQLRSRPDEVEGHELDWLAIEMTYGESNKDRGPWFLVSGPSQEEESKADSSINDGRDGVSPAKGASSFKSVSPCQSVSTLQCLDPLASVEVIEEKENGKALLCAFQDSCADERPHHQEQEKNLRLAEARWQSRNGWDSEVQFGIFSHRISQPCTAERLFYYRSRLAELTSHSSVNKSKGPADWGDRLIPIRRQAQQLKIAIEASTSILFTHCKILPKWRKARSLAVSLNVMVPSPSNPVNSQIHIFVRQPDFNSKVRSAVWEVDRNALEAVLGLWNWSIVSDHKLEQEDNAGLKTSLASEVRKARVIAVGVSEKQLVSAQNELDTWSNDLFAFTTNQTWQLKQDANPLGANTVWKKNCDNKSLEPQFGRCNSVKQLIRLFGWPATSLSNDMSALTVVSKLSIPTLCAQEIYQHFIGAMATTLDSLGGTTKPRVEDNTRIYLTNDVISRLADSVVSSGLGSQQDAYSILIPILSRRSKLPVPTAIMPKVYSIAKENMLSGKFEEAEKDLRWARQVGVQAHAQRQQDSSLKTATIELAEFYRYTWRKSLLEKDCEKRRHVRGVGRRGASWLKDITHSKASDPCPDEIREMMGRYSKLSKEWDIQITQSDAPASEVVRYLFANRLSLCLALIAEDPKFADEKGRTLLSWAAEKGCQEIVQSSLAIGAQVDSEDESKRTPLSYAAENGHADVVRVLLQHNAQPLALDSRRRTPLSYASQTGNDSILNDMMNYRPVTADAGDDSGWTPLHWAAHCGIQNSIKMLMAKQFDMDATDNYGRTPLIIALVNRHEAAATQLLEGGATWEINIDGEEAWKWAFSNGHWSSGEFLLNLMNRKHNGLETSLIRILYIPLDPISSAQRTICRQDALHQETPSTSRQPSTVTIFELTNEGEHRPPTACTLLRVLERPYYHEIWVDKFDQRGTRDTMSLEIRESCTLRDRVERLLLYLGPDVKTTDQMLLGILRASPQTGLSFGELMATLQLLLEKAGNDFVVSREIVEAAKNSVLATSALSILLKREWKRGNFSTQILGEIMCLSRTHGLRSMKEYLEGQVEGFDVADGLLIAVLQHEQDDLMGLKVLLNHRKKGVTAKTLSTALQNLSTHEDGFGGMRGDGFGNNVRRLFYLHDMGEHFHVEGLEL